MIDKVTLASRNSAALFAAIAGAAEGSIATDDVFVAVDLPQRGHVVMTSPTRRTRTLAARLRSFFGDGKPVQVEDAWAALDLAPHGYGSELWMPVMVRAPGRAADAAGGPDTPARVTPARITSARVEPETERVVSPETLARVADIIVEIFGLPETDPAHFAPSALLAAEGMDFWLAGLDGEPAGAALSYDDGHSVGVYWVATLPTFRRRGVARALLNEIISRYGGRSPLVLTASEAGRPLYESVGFASVSTARWWRRAARGEAA